MLTPVELAESFPTLGQLLEGTLEDLTAVEVESFTTAARAAMALGMSVGSDAILRCLDVGLASLVRRRELAREVEMLTKRNA
jgi:hypothetical protein